MNLVDQHMYAPEFVSSESSLPPPLGLHLRLCHCAPWLGWPHTHL